LLVAVYVGVGPDSDGCVLVKLLRMVIARTFDRRPSIDRRRFRYQMAALPAVADLVISSYSWRYVQLDQGAEGACVLFDVTMEAAARPRPFFGDPVHDPPDVRSLNQRALSDYWETQLSDEFADTPPEEGTSLNAGMHTGMRRGYWGGFMWADPSDAEHAALQTLAALRHGPVCFACDWYTGMDKADANGYLRDTGAIRGGHSPLLTAVSARRMAAFTPNSWGGEGQGWFDLPTLTRLFERGAEAAIPSARRLA